MPEPLRIIFCGTPTFAVPSLRALAADARFRVTHVITQPDRPVGRAQHVTPPPVKTEAERLGIPVLQPEKLNTAWPTLMKEHAIARPEFLVVVAYGQIINQAMLDVPTIAPVNVHASLLPKYRGASPIQHAILGGDTETGVTLQRMVLKLDAGPIIAQARIPLQSTETAVHLHDTLSELGADLLVTTLSGTLHETPQEEGMATHCKKLTRADGAVHPAEMTAEEIDRRVRALVPWPGVTWDDLKILSTSLVPVDDAASIPCAEGTTLYVRSIQPAGKKPMTGASWVHGRKSDRLR